MKPDIHPKYRPVKVVCSCGYTFETRSTVNKDILNVEICSNCHPFYTGKQKAVDTAGRVEKFQKRYSDKKVPAKIAPTVAEPVKAKPAKTEPVKAKAAKAEAGPVKAAKSKKK